LKKEVGQTLAPKEEELQMRLKGAKIAFGLGLLALSFLLPNLSRAQAAVMLSGTVLDSTGRVVSSAKISVKNLRTGKSSETESNSAGRYTVPNLAPVDYQVTVSAEGLATQAAGVTLAADKQQTLNVSLNTGSAPQEIPANKPATASPAGLPTAPSGSATSPSLQDLGFTTQQTQANAQLQEMLEKRTHMLKVHQTLGLITAIPMAASLITGPQAKAKGGKDGQVITEPTTANLDFHVALGGLTTGLYWTTAYYSIFAPKVPDIKPKGAIRLHRDLEWVHGPGMILTPVLGIMAYKQENAGEKVHGIASQHGTVAYVTAAAYGASIVSISWPIHWQFWK
jgi:Carboxypeptidase regulatory-like domain